MTIQAGCMKSCPATCVFDVQVQLDLNKVTRNTNNVEYRKEQNKVIMKIRTNPTATANIWSSGKITCVGATSETEAKRNARRFARILQKVGYENVNLKNFRVTNFFGVVKMPFEIKLESFSHAYKEANFDPEHNPGVTYKFEYPKATLKIFRTGSITIIARSESDMKTALESIYPLIRPFQKPKTVKAFPCEQCSIRCTTKKVIY